MPLTYNEKQTVINQVKLKYETRNAESIHFCEDGAVSVMVDRIPCTNEKVRIFAGWDYDILNADKTL